MSNVLIACEFSGIVRDAFRRQGHDAISCDLLDTESPDKLNHFKCDIRHVLEDFEWDLMIAHPPCTRLANSGVRWLHIPPKGKTLEQMWEEFHAGVEFYKFLREAKIPRIAIENPVQHCYAVEKLGFIRRHTVQPWWFGEPYFKATGFELINLPPLKPTKMLTPPKKGTEEHKKWSAVHRASPGPDRWKDRSRTFLGIAEAMAKQWGDLL